jgi:AAHS family 4-hydroxybenzoate transporter-like MFS transporter
MMSLALIVGLSIPSAALAINPVAIAFYPTEMRATGTNWMHGIGRCGGILSGFVGAAMLSAGWSFSLILLSLAVPCGLAALALLLKGFIDRSPGASTREAGAVGVLTD